MAIDFILYGTAYLSVVFMLHLFTFNYGNLFLNRMLALLFFMRTLNNLILIIYSYQVFEQNIRILLFSESLVLLVPSLFYLYIRSFLYDQTKLEKKDLLHAIPFILTISTFLLILITKSKTDNIYLYASNFKLYLVATGSTMYMVYLFFCFRMLFKVLTNKNHSLNKVSLNWLYFLLFIVSFTQLTKLMYALLVIVGFSNPEDFFNSRVPSFATGIATTFFVLFVLRNPDVLYGNLTPRFKLTDLNKSDITEKTTEVEFPPFSSSELLKLEEIAGYLSLIENYMKTELPFLDHSFSIGQMSETLNIPVHHCSFVLNRGMMKNFREYINKYRVDYFIQQYPIMIQTQTLESIAALSGFKSSSTFYTVFKKETGTSPTNYFSAS